MPGNLAHSSHDEDDTPNNQQRPRRHLNIVPPSRQNSIPQGYVPRADHHTEEEIVVDAGIWIVFNRRILSWIQRKQHRNGE